MLRKFNITILIYERNSFSSWRSKVEKSLWSWVFTKSRNFAVINNFQSNRSIGVDKNNSSRSIEIYTKIMKMYLEILQHEKNITVKVLAVRLNFSTSILHTLMISRVQKTMFSFCTVIIKRWNAKSAILMLHWKLVYISQCWT